MKNNKTKQILIIVLILLVLLIIIIAILNNKIGKNGGLENIFSNTTQNKTIEEDFLDDEEPAIDEDDKDEYLEDLDGESEIDKSQMPADTEKEGLRDVLYTETPREVTSSIYYSTVKNIIKTFLKDIEDMSTKQYLNKTDIYSIINSDLRKKTYDRLSQDYIEKKEIDINNISQKIHISANVFNYNIEKMMQYAIKNNQILRFAVRLNIQSDEESYRVSNFIIYLDYENQSYSIEPIGNENIENIKLDSNISEIIKNINNTYVYMNE